MRYGTTPALIAVLLACASAPAAGRAAAGEVLSGTAARVESGDTFVLRSGSGEIEVRLADIGAPQRSEYYAAPARALLEGMLGDAALTVEVTGRRDPAHAYARVRRGELDVNLELVRRGAAWVCWEYAQDTDYLPYETDARRWRRGLWAGTWEIDARADCNRRPPATKPVHGS